MSEERKSVAEELRRVRDEVRRRAFLGTAAPGAPPREAEARPAAPPEEDLPAEEPAPTPPDAAAVNEAWRAEAPARGGRVRRFLERLLAPRLEAQRTFNARQVQLDNEILRYLEARFAATHRHYDRVLGLYGRHLGEADERHMILQEELVVHAQDLVRRIDLVLAESHRGRLALEFDLEDLRARLERLEESLRRG